MSDNDNIDQATNQKIYFLQAILYEVKLLNLLSKIEVSLCAYKKSCNGPEKLTWLIINLTAHMPLTMQH